MRGGTAQARVHEKADLIRENNPCSPLPTPRRAIPAYFVNSSVSNSLSLVGTCTLTRTRRSPRPRPVQAMNASLPIDELLARLRARRHRDLLVAVERRKQHLGAERRLGDRDRQLGDEIVAITGDRLVCRDTDVHVQIAGPATTRADRAATGQTQGGAGVDTGRARRPGTSSRRSPGPRRCTSGTA